MSHGNIKWFFLLRIVLILHFSCQISYADENIQVNKGFAVKKPRTTDYEQRRCSFVKGLHANLIRFVTQEGFHRELEDTIEVTVTTSQIPTKYFSTGECILGLLHVFSKDVYVDPYEIKAHPLRNEYIQVLNNWTDLESPSWLANSTSVVFMQLKTILTGNLISTEPFPVPIHYRYQKPRSQSEMKKRSLTNKTNITTTSPREKTLRINTPSGYIPVTLPLPELILRCDYWDNALVEEQCKTVSIVCDRKSSPDSKCIWAIIPYKSNNKSGTVLIPIGDLDNRFIVTCVTIIVVCIGMLFVMYTLVNTKIRLDLEQHISNLASIHQQQVHPHVD